MADDGLLGKDLKETIKNLEALNDAGTNLQNVFGDIGDRVRNLASKSTEFKDRIEDAAKEAEALKKEAKDLSKFNLESLKSSTKTEQFLRRQVRLEEKRSQLNSRIRTLQDEAATASKEEARILNRVTETLDNASTYTRDISDEFKRIVKSNDELNKKTNFFDSLAEIVGDVPILNKVFKEFGNAAEKAREAAAQSEDGMKAGAKELSKAASKAIKVFTVSTLRKGLISADERVVSLSRNLNMTEKAARATVRQLNRFSESTKGITGTDLQNSITNISDAFGVTADLSNESATALTTMTKYLGLSADESAQLAKFSAVSSQEVENLTENLAGEVQILNARNETGIKYQAVMKDVAGASDAIRLSTQGSGQNLNKAAFEAKRLGLSLSQADNIAGSLLDFESSIAAELEAELLTGRQLNLEKARQYALNNNIEGVVSEIAKNMGSAAEFGKMNRIQQEAVAKAVGMTRDELAASLAEKEAIRKFGVTNKMALDAELNAELKKIDTLKQQGKFEEATAARKKLIAKTGSEELVRQRENRTLAETQAEAMEKLGQAADAFLGIMNGIKSVFDGIAQIARTIVKLFTAFTVAGGNLTKSFKGVKNILGSISNMLKNVTKQTDRVATATMNATGQRVSGAAAQSAVRAGTATANTFVGGSGAASGGGGLLSRLGKGGIMKKLGSVLKKSAGKLLKIPVISSLIEAIFASQDIKNIINEGGSKNDIYQAIGKRSAQAIGSIGVGAFAAFFGSALGPLGTVAAGILGDSFGRWAGGKLADTFGAEGLGKFVSKTFGYEDLISTGVKNNEISVDDFVIKTNPKDTITMAGGTKLGGNVEKLLEELIVVVKAGGDVYMDGAKVGKSIALATSRIG